MATAPGDDWSFEVRNLEDIFDEFTSYEKGVRYEWMEDTFGLRYWSLVIGVYFPENSTTIPNFTVEIRIQRGTGKFNAIASNPEVAEWELLQGVFEPMVSTPKLVEN